MVDTMSKNTLIISITIGLLSIGTALSQSLEVGYGNFGAMVYWQGILPPAEGAEILRTTDGQREEVMRWRIQPIHTPEEFMQNLEGKPPVFKNMFTFTEGTAVTLLKRVNEASRVDRIPLHQFPNILFALGLAVWDTTVVEGETYRYQILIDGVPIDDGVSLHAVLPTEYDWLPTFHSTSSNQTIIHSRWNIPYEKRAEVITYLAYRSTPFKPDYQLVDGIRNFSVIDDTFIAVFSDTTLTQLGVYHYVIRPVNRFGEIGPLSEYAQGSNFPPETEPLLVYFNAEGLRDRPAIHLKWRIQNTWRIRSLALYRSREFDGPYELLRYIPPRDTTYLDHVDDVMESYFYYFEMNDIAQPFPIKTNRVGALSDYPWPAVTPNSVEAVVNGPDITIRWKRAGFQDRGYYVMRTQGYGEPNQLVSEFIRVVEGQEYYEWTDTTAAMSPEHTYGYGVISESIGYVQSELSEVVHARPDVPIHVPAPGDLRISRTGDTTFLLSWRDHSSDETLHHLGYRVYQRDNAAEDGYRVLTPEMLLFETNWLELSDITPEDTFTVKAYNIFGDESVYSLPASLHDPFFYRFGPEYLMGQNEEEGIRVRWNRPLRSNITGYTLYRIGEDERMVQVATPGVEETNWLDTQVNPGETYYYFITAHESAGMSSMASELLNITRY
jgi:hypothetical protein